MSAANEATQGKYRLSGADRNAVAALLAAAPPVPPQSAEHIDTAMGALIRAAYERQAATPDRVPAA